MKDKIHNFLVELFFGRIQIVKFDCNSLHVCLYSFVYCTNVYFRHAMCIMVMLYMLIVAF